MTDNRDDRFGAPSDDEFDGDERSIRLPLPPPGLFARLDAPEEPEEPAPAVEEEPAPYSYRDLLLSNAEVDEDDPTEDEEPADEDPEDDVALADEPHDEADAFEDEAPELDDPDPDRDEPQAAAGLAGVADAVDIVEQLASMPPPPLYSRAPEEEEAILEARAALAGIADDPDDEPVSAEQPDGEEPDVQEPDVEADEPGGGAEAQTMPDYALVVDDEETKPEGGEEPAFVLPRYGAERTTATVPEEEILPHFLLEDAAPLDVIAAQDELREMARKNRRKADRDADHKPSLARTLAEIPILLVVAAVIAFLVKTFVAQAYYIPSGSMLPQLEIDDRVVVSKLAYKLHDPRRGDIVVFDDPKNGDSGDTDDGRSGVSKLLRKVGEGVGVVQPSTDEFIKRVIALPGEEVSGRDGYVYINDHKLIEPYLPEGIRTEDFAPQTVAKDKLWVMGDNRSGSADSRIFGQIDIDTVVGRAVIKVWPFSHISFL